MFKFNTPPLPSIDTVTKNGRRDSAQGTLPAAGGMPSIIIKWREKFENFRDKECQRAQEVLNKLGDEVGQAASRFDLLFLRTRFTDETPCLNGIKLAVVENSLRAEGRELQEREQNFTRFQRIHERPYLPVRAYVALDPWWKVYGLVMALFVVEALINAFIFKETAGAGFAEAMILSTSQAFINIVSCYIIGLKVYGPAFVVPLSFKKAVYWFVLSLHLVFILWLNLSLGRWRSVMVDLPTKVFKKIPLEEMVTLTPWKDMPSWTGNTPANLCNKVPDQVEMFCQTAWTMQAAIVVGVGMVLALLAYLKGYFSDDPYPGYGRIYRYVLRSRKRTHELIKDLAEKTHAARREFDGASVNIHDKAFEDVGTWSQAIDDMDQITSDYRILLQGMNGSFENVCQAYKQGYAAVSLEAANTLEPSKCLFDESSLNTNKVFDDVSQHFLEDNARLARVEEHQDELRKTFEEIRREYTEKLDGLDEGFLKLSQQYAPETNNGQAE